MGIKTGSKLISVKDRKLLKQFGLIVRQKREKMNLTLYDVSGDDLGIRSWQHWQKIESGQKNINLTTFFKICQTLGIQPNKLLKDFDLK